MQGKGVKYYIIWNLSKPKTAFCLEQIVQITDRHFPITNLQALCIKIGLQFECYQKFQDFFLMYKFTKIQFDNPRCEFSGIAHEFATFLLLFPYVEH